MSSERSWPSRLISFFLHQLLALVVLVGFPAGWTAMAPVSWIVFERHDGRVSATARTCLLFVVPYKIRTVEPVIGIGDRFVAGSISRERRNGRDHQTKSENQGYLLIQGNEQVAEVPVTPYNLESVIERLEAFLNDPQAAELSLFVVANWKFSVFGGGLISLLTVLYVSTLAFGLVLQTVRLVQRAVGVPPEQRWLAKYQKA